MTDNEPFEVERTDILRAMLKRAPFEGWTPLALRRAATDVGLDRAVQHAAFPGGIADSLQFWSEQLDRAMRDAMAGDEFQAQKIRDKVRLAVSARLAAMGPHKEAARRAAATLALPIYGALGARLAWRTADEVWRGLNDPSTDFNYYSKRAILTGVWTTTFARWLADDSLDEAATQRFLAARIANVMQIEKVKAKARDFGVDPAAPFSLLAKLRYGPGRRGAACS